MIDIEADVFDAVYPSVAPLLPDGGFQSEFVANPASFPHATLIEIDNSTDAPSRSSSLDEEYALLTYEANVYALKKAQCRAVMAALNDAMIRLGFQRMTMNFVPNLVDRQVFRAVARYRAIADQNKMIYRKSR